MRKKEEGGLLKTEKGAEKQNEERYLRYLFSI